MPLSKKTKPKTRRAEIQEELERIKDQLRYERLVKRYFSLQQKHPETATGFPVWLNHATASDTGADRCS